MKNKKSITIAIALFSLTNLPAFSMLKDDENATPLKTKLASTYIKSQNDSQPQSQQSIVMDKIEDIQIEEVNRDQFLPNVQDDLSDDLQKIEKRHTYSYQPSLINHLKNIEEETLKIATSELISNQDSQDGIKLQSYSIVKPINTAEEYYYRLNEPMPYTSILSLDGGGFRGLMQAYWLDYLESKDVLNRPLHKIFNLIAGTSIGGILTLASAIPGIVDDAPALSTKQMIDLFVSDGNKIFPQRWKYNYPGKLWDFAWGTFRSTYDERPLENLLRGSFSNKPLSSALTDVIITSATAEKQRPFLFSSFHDDRNHYEAWRVARATSAAPTYFKAFNFMLPKEYTEQYLVDGGLWLNNPSAIAYETALFTRSKTRNYFVHHDNIVMLSLGTGEMSVQYQQPHNAGWLNSARPLIEAMMNYSTNGVDESMKVVLKDNYVRINPKFDENVHIPLDCIDWRSISLLEEAAKNEKDRIDSLFKEGGILWRILERDETNTGDL